MRIHEQIDPAKTSVRLVPGRALSSGKVSVAGVSQPAVWVNSARALPGDAVQVLFLDHPTAQSQAIVLGRTGQPLPQDGTVATVGTETVTVMVGDETVEATFLANYAPASGDNVRLLWDGPEPTVLGKVSTIVREEPAEDENETRPPPAPKQSGTQSFTASDSGTWSGSLYRWNSYYGRRVYQGNGSRWGAPSTNHGAWFYHDKPSRLQGRKITRARVWLPARARAGSYNSSARIVFYLHSSKRKPNGDVNRGAETKEHTVNNWNGGWVNLPSGWGDKIVAGDGLAIAGGDYAGFNHSTRSGMVELDWEE